MKCPKCKHEFKDPARVKGGMVSRRTITKEQQAKMQAGRKSNANVQSVATSDRDLANRRCRDSIATFCYAAIEV